MTLYFYPVQQPLSPATSSRLVVTFCMTLLGLVTALNRWRNTRRAIAELQGLNDHTLKDIGISRSQIEYVVRGKHAPYGL